MMFKSGINLHRGISDFIQEKESVSILCPYIKVSSLQSLLTDSSIRQIVVRWLISDLVQGSSDLELFDFCQQNNIALYRNTRIHLKAFWDNADSVMFGSSNITKQGIGEIGNYNYELNGSCHDISFEDKLFLQNIIAESELVDQNLYEKIKKIVEETPKPTMDYTVLDTSKTELDYFLLSQLPMSETPAQLFQIYSDPLEFSSEDQKYALCDLSLYRIPLGLNEQDFFELLADEFNQHPFVLKLKEHIKSTPYQSLHYGGVVSWLRNNTTTVPTPRSWELKRNQIVNILYEWICYFDSKFSWNRPNYTQVISYNHLRT